MLDKDDCEFRLVMFEVLILFLFRARSSVSPDPPGLSEFGKVSNVFLWSSFLIKHVHFV